MENHLTKRELAQEIGDDWSLFVNSGTRLQKHIIALGRKMEVADEFDLRIHAKKFLNMGGKIWETVRSFQESQIKSESQNIENPVENEFRL